MMLVLVMAATVGTWEITETRDPMTDKAQATAIVPADDGGKFVLTCRSASEDRSLSFQYIAPKYLRSSYTRVEFRIDGGEVFSQLWDYQAKTAYTFDPKLVKALGDRLAGANRLLVRAYDFNAQPVTSAFDLAETEAAIARVREICAS